MFAWLPAEHLQLRPPDGLGAVATEAFTSGCSSTSARWVAGGLIAVQGVVSEKPLPHAVEKWTDLIRSAAAQAGVPPQLVAGIMATESGGQQKAHSWCCYGLMGFLPATASSVAGRPVTAHELMEDPALNVELGAKLIKQLLTKYKGNIVKVALAYNAGSVKCGAPKNCSNAPNKWNAITDCAQGKAVDYPQRMFDFSNAWVAKHGTMTVSVGSSSPGFLTAVLVAGGAAVALNALGIVNFGKLKRNPLYRLTGQELADEIRTIVHDYGDEYGWEHSPSEQDVLDTLADQSRKHGVDFDWSEAKSLIRKALK